MKKIFIIIAILATSFTSSCRRDHLYYSYGKVANLEVNVNLATAESDNVDLDLNGASAYVFDSATGEAFGGAYISSDPTKLNISLPVGTYDIVVINDTEYELENINFVGTKNLSSFSAEIISAEASKYSVFDSRANDNRYVTECDELVYGLISNVVIEEVDVAYYEKKPTVDNLTVTKSVTVDLHHATEMIDIEVEVENLTSAASPPRTQLTNMSAGGMFKNGAKLNSLVTHEFILNNRVFDTKATTTGRISKKLISFGPLTISRSNYTNDHHLVMHYILNNGETHLVDMPVNDVMTSSYDDVRAQHTIRAKVTLPEAIGGDEGGGAFDPEIEQWEDVSVDMPI